MELRQLEAFISIATLRSFRAAANRLNVTQPAISARLRSLEDELGKELIDRSGPEIRLTGSGAELLPYAEKIIDFAQQLKGTASGKIRARRFVRLGATNTIVSSWLPQLMSEVLETMPYLDMEVVMDTTRRLRELLSAGELDIAMLSGPLHEKGIRNVPLSAYPNQWIVGRNSPVGDAAMTLDELAAFPIVTYARDSGTFSSLEELFRLNGLWPVRLNSCSSSEAIIRVVERSHAIGLVSSACLDFGEQRHGVRLLQMDFHLPTYEFFAAYHLDAVGRIGMAIAEIARRIANSESPGSLFPGPIATSG